MKLKILVVLFSLMSAGVSAQEDSLLKSHSDEFLFSLEWMQYQTDFVQLTFLVKEGKRYFLCEYNKDDKLMFKSEVEVFFGDAISYKQNLETGERTLIETFCDSMRLHGKRKQFDPDTGKVIAMSRYRHGKRIKFKSYRGK